MALDLVELPQNDVCIALLFEVARDLPRAVDHFLLAAQHAAGVFANQEAALLARKGLDLLKGLPPTPERTRQELKFQTTLGVALRNTKGFAAPEARVEDGLAQIQEGIAGYRATGAELETPYWLSLLAQAHGRAGQPEEGLRTLTEALQEAQQRGVRFCEAELHRLRGELLLQQAVRTDQEGGCGPSDPAAIDARVMTEAEACFRVAVEIARGQQAKSLELRAVTSFSRLLRRQGRRDEACEMLTSVYGWFTEGLGTADLREAAALLQELAIEPRT